jgi:hypothetical protein
MRNFKAYASGWVVAKGATEKALGEYPTHHAAVDIGQTEIAACMAIGQPFMVDA